MSSDSQLPYWGAGAAAALGLIAATGAALVGRGGAAPAPADPIDPGVPDLWNPVIPLDPPLGSGTVSDQVTLVDYRTRGHFDAGNGVTGDGSAEVKLGHVNAEASWDSRTLQGGASAHATLFEVDANGEVDLGDLASAHGSAHAVVGQVDANVSVDAKTATASASASAVVASADADGGLDTPFGGVDVNAEANGPEAHASGSIGGTNGFDFGASAGDVSAGEQADFAGGKFGGDVDLGLKADFGIQVGETTGIDLPFVSLHVDSSGLPGAAAALLTGDPAFEIGAAISAAEWAAGAIGDFVSDPVGTIGGASDDVGNAVSDAANAAANAASDAANTIANAASDAANDVSNAANDVANDVSNAVSDVGEALSSFNPF